MTHAYSEMYLDDAMRTLGEAVDFALCDQGLNPAELTAILSNAFEMKQFEHGIPRVVCGMSGDELARDIIAHAGLSPVECRETYPFDRSPQYWAGWVLAYAQWMCSLCFIDLLEVAPLDWIIGSYHPLHEASEDKFAQIVIENGTTPRQAKGPQSGMKGGRPNAKQLAAQSGLNCAIQLYEQNQLDLRRASVSSALALANTLTVLSKTSSGSRLPWSTIHNSVHPRISILRVSLFNFP
ncbi:MAG: hypothetical protein ACLS3M_00860 [Collinsella sp.]